MLRQMRMWISCKLELATRAGCTTLTDRAGRDLHGIRFFVLLSLYCLSAFFLFVFVLSDVAIPFSGTVTFVIGFAGCVGALRENTCLLAAVSNFFFFKISEKIRNSRNKILFFQYAIFLAILLLLEMTVGVLGFIFKDSIKTQATRGFQAFIIHYREDPDQQNLIDWIQEDWLQCCGIEGPKDWDRNNYFNCSSREVGSREACGVPFSCCKRKPNVSYLRFERPSREFF